MISSLFEGKANVTPVAWNMPVQKDPPMLVLEIGEKHHIFDCIMDTGDFAVNIPSVSMAEDLVKCGRVSGREVNKVDMCAFSLVSSKNINSLALDDSIAILECVLVRDEHLLKEYNMVVGEIKYAEVEEGLFTDHWILEDDSRKTLHHLGDKTFCVPDGEVIDLR